MHNRFPIGLYGVLLVGLILAARPASAQFASRAPSDAAVGEKYFIEGALGFWAPSAAMTISSEGFNIIGSEINFKRDLGLVDHKFRELRATLRPARKQKVR